MKNLFGLFAVIILSCFVIYSCNKQDSKSESHQKTENSYPELEKLATNLSVYLDQFEGKSHTRNGWRWVAAGFADYGGWQLGSKLGAIGGTFAGGPAGTGAGYCIGGLIGAGLASAATLLADFAVITGDTLMNSTNLYDNFGSEHNALVAELLDRKDEYMLDGVIDNEKFFSLAIEIIESMGHEVVVQDENEAVRSVNNLLEETKLLTLDENCVNQYFDKLSIQYPEEIPTIDIQRKYMLKAITLNSVEDLHEFTSGYENIIVKSQIEEQDKEILLTGSSLMKNSMVAYEYAE